MFTERYKPNPEQKSHDIELLKAVLTLLHHISIMAGWSRFSRSLIIYLLVGLIAVQFFKNASKLPMHDRLQILSTSQDRNRPKIDSAPSKTKSSSKSSSKMAPTSKLVLAAKLLNITLAANLILLANDVSSNPGPATSLPFEAKGLRAFHINICSLS